MKKNWQTKLIHSDAKIPGNFRSLAPPVYRASTVTFPDCASIAAGWDPEEVGYTYGVFGTPTSLELAARIAELEHGSRTLLAPSGLSAIALVDLAFLSTGSHVLLPDNVYLPSRLLAVQTLRRFGIEAEFYPAGAGSSIASCFRSNTHLIWTESPGSVTMELQDIPAIAEAAHRHDIPVAMDNTWSAGVFFTAFEYGVDVSVQAATKYIGGHSDLLLGAVTVREAAFFAQLGETRARLGFCVSPDECSLALRGLQTLAVRLHHVEASALHLAQWLEQRPEIQAVLHPGLPSPPTTRFGSGISPALRACSPWSSVRSSAGNKSALLSMRWSCSRSVIAGEDQPVWRPLITCVPGLRPTTATAWFDSASAWKSATICKQTWSRP